MIRVRLFLVGLVVLALLGVVGLAIRPSADTIEGGGITLAVVPDKLRMRNTDASNVLLKLTAGASFSGQVSVSVSGLPTGVVARDTDPDSNSHSCSSACLAAPSQDFPLSLGLSPSQQVVLNPTLVLTDGSVTPGTYTLTYTATTSSGSSSDTLSLVVAADDPFTHSELKISESGYVTPTLSAKAGSSLTVQNLASGTDSVTADGGSFDTGPIASFGSATLMVPSDGSYPFHPSPNPSKTGTLKAVTIQPRTALTGSTKGSPIEKPTLKAGESVTLTWTGSTGSAGQAVDVVTSSVLDSSMTVSTSPSALSFASQSDYPTVDVTVTTKATTPNGIYGVLLGTRHPDGSVYEPEAVSLKVTGGTEPTSGSPPSSPAPGGSTTPPASQGGSAPAASSPSAGTAAPAPTSSTTPSSSSTTPESSPPTSPESTTTTSSTSPSTPSSSSSPGRAASTSKKSPAAPTQTTPGESSETPASEPPTENVTATRAEQVAKELYKIDEPTQLTDRQAYTADSLVAAAADPTLAAPFVETTVTDELTNPLVQIQSITATAAGCQTAASACTTTPITLTDSQLPDEIRQLLKRVDVAPSQFIQGFSGEAQQRIAAKLRQWGNPRDKLERIIIDLFMNDDKVRSKLPDDLDGYAINNYLNTRLRHIYPLLGQYPEPYAEYCYVEPQRLRERILWWEYDAGRRGQGTIVLYKPRPADEVLRRQIDEAQRQNAADTRTAISSAVLQLRGGGASMCDYLAQFVYHEYIQLFGDTVVTQSTSDFPFVYEQILEDWAEIDTYVLQRAFTRLELEALEEGVTLRLAPDGHSVVLVSVSDDEGYFNYLTRKETLAQIAAARSGIKGLKLMAITRPGRSAPTSWLVPTTIAQETAEAVKSNYLVVQVGGIPMGLMVTDPTGRSAGYNLVNGEEIHQLGEAVYEGARSDHTTLLIPGLLHGDYEVMLIPLADGQYSGTIHVAFGDQVLTRELAGQAVANQPLIETVTVAIDAAEPFAASDARSVRWMWWLVAALVVLGLAIVIRQTLKRKSPFDSAQDISAP